MFPCFAVAADPQAAQNDFEQFCEAYFAQTGQAFKPNPTDPRLKLFGNSRFLSSFVIRHPKFLAELDPKTLLNPTSALEIDFTDARTTRLSKYQALLSLTLKDLNDYPTVLLLTELSVLANTIVSGVDQHLASVDLPPYSILAMGKLGGMELNYSSDIDLIALMGNPADESDLPEQIEALTRHLQKLSQALTQKTEDGFLYRTDWDLRPEGKSGQWVRSLAGTIDYYAERGANWERQMLLKTRHLTGNHQLTNEFLEKITPYVFRKYFDLESLDRILEMKAKVQAELAKTEATHKGFHVKLGRGGIREIEFMVCALLLVYGGKNPALRLTGTLPALAALGKEKLMEPAEVQTLTQNYLFLRKLENSLQMAEEAQTHFLADTPKAQLEAARRVGFYQSAPEEALAHFQNRVNRVREEIHQRFERFFLPNPARHFWQAHADLMDPEQSEAWETELHQQVLTESSYEKKLDCIRLFKKAKHAEIQLLEKRALTARKKILFQLSVVATLICRETLMLALNEVEKIYGKPFHRDDKGSERFSELIAVGMGKLGGHEINYASDLDLIFIYSEEGETSGPKIISNQEFFAKTVQKFITSLSASTVFGRAYEIDTELRPSGHSGLLVTSLASFMEYQKTVSQTWEHQALLRARPIAGSAVLCQLFESQKNSLLFSSPHPTSIATEMARIRTRVEKEVAKETPNSIHLKLGRGSMMDIEFVVQYLQLTHGADFQKLQTANTIEALQALLVLNLLPRAQDATLLLEAYTFYRTWESKIMLQMGRSIGRISLASPELEGLARELRFDNVEKLLEQVELYRTRVREIYNSVFR